MKLKHFLSGKKTQKCLCASFFAFALFQFYFLQEMLAALLLFTVAFLLLASIALVLYLLDLGFRSSIDLLEAHARPSFLSNSNAAVSRPVQQDKVRVTKLRTRLVLQNNGKTIVKYNERLKASVHSTSTREMSGQV